jgi:hypothetical protein
MVIIVVSAIGVITMNATQVNAANFIEKLSSLFPKFKRDAALKIMEDKEYLINGYAQSLQYKESFFNKNISIHDELNKSLNTKGFKKGQLVTYVNEYGFCFPNFEIVGFDNFSNDGRYIYLNFDSFWCPVSMDNIVLQDGLILLNESDIEAAIDLKNRLYH